MRRAQREVVYSKDVALIMGCSLRTAQRVLQDVRDAVGKGAGDYVTVSEFCEVKGFREIDVRVVITVSG